MEEIELYKRFFVEDCNHFLSYNRAEYSKYFNILSRFKLVEKTNKKLLKIKNKFKKFIKLISKSKIKCLMYYHEDKYFIKIAYKNQYMEGYIGWFSHYKISCMLKDFIIFEDDMIEKVISKYYTEKQLLKKLQNHILPADLLKIVYSYLLIGYL